MAEDKNGFLLYKDLIHSVRKLPKEKAGELFMHILSYVNDENPETDDLLVELTFEPVKQALKRDLVKYEKTKEKNRENALKRWQKKDATVSESIPKNATASERMPTYAKHADIDMDNGSDIGSDSDTDILLEKETKEEKLIKENSENGFDSETVKPEETEKEKSCAKKEKVKPPDLETFLDAGREIYQNELKLDFSLYEFALRAKYESWLDAGWKDGHKKPILNWKSKLRNIIPFLKPIYGKSNNNKSYNSTTTQNGNSYGGSKVSGKVSASSILAREARKQFAGDGHSGNQTA